MVCDHIIVFAYTCVREGAKNILRGGGTSDDFFLGGGLIDLGLIWGESRPTSSILGGGRSMVALIWGESDIFINNFLTLGGGRCIFNFFV
jgi:hypothetical protein